MGECIAEPGQHQGAQSMSIKHLIALGFYESEKNKNITDQILAEDGPKLSGGASLKLQLIPAIRSAQKLGLKPAALSLHSPIHASESFKQKRCICLIGKMSSNREDLVKIMIRANLPFIRELKELNCPILIQYSDNILSEKNILSEFYAEIFKMANAIIYPSSALMRLNKDKAPEQCKTTVIRDPWQLESLQTPRSLKAKQECKIVWYGSAKNTKYLLKCLPKLLLNSPKNRAFELTILGLKISHDLIKNFIQQQSLKVPSNWNIRMVTWNHSRQPQQLEEEITRAHIALIPSDPTDPLKAGVSHNRLVDALRGGCIPIASPMDSYLELGDIALLGNEMDLLLKEAIDSYDSLSSKIIEKRDELLKEFDPESNKQAWTQLLRDVISTS